MPEIKLQATGVTQYHLTLLVTLLAFSVVLLGAYVRLFNAGLDCPDWPGCYVQINVPTSQSEINSANSAYPLRPADSAKAWKEMSHRLGAPTTTLYIGILSLLLLKKSHTSATQRLGWIIALLLILQLGLGIGNVMAQLPLAVAVTHNGVAALLVLSLITLAVHTRRV